MDSYFKRNQILKSGEKDLSVVRASSVPPQSRSSSVEPPQTRSNENQKKELLCENKESCENKEKVCKVARLSHIDTLEKKNQLLENVINVLQTDISSCVSQIDEIKKDLSNSNESSKNEKIKLRLDDFINKYNENEQAHSAALSALEKGLNNQLKTVSDRLLSVEELL